jgi:hypothetical protein
LSGAEQLRCMLSYILVPFQHICKGSATVGMSTAAV